MTDPESISLGGSLPQWMRMRPDVKYDVEGGTSFSPPAHDDSFFYIRYPIGQDNQKPAAGQIQALTDALSDVQLKGGATEANQALKSTSSAIASTSAIATPAAAAKQQQFAKHTEPCKMFLTSNENRAAPLPTFAHVKNQTKPFGTDDGFDGEGAACGTSIVRVARQMVSGKSLSRGFTVANFSGDLEAHPEHHPSDDEQLEQRFMSHPRNLTRRGSKSLPASPLGSPKSMRKVQPNPYFCVSGFGGGQSGTVAAAAATTKGTPTAGSSGGWFLSGLLGYQRGDIASSTTSVVSNISEEVEEGHEAIVSVTGAAGGIGNATGNGKVAGQQTSSTTTTARSTAVPNTGAANSFAQPKLLKAKPSELREMNFWSPTSM